MFRMNQPFAFDALGRHWVGRVHSVSRNKTLTVRVHNPRGGKPFLLCVDISKVMVQAMQDSDWSLLPEPIEPPWRYLNE